MPNDADWIPGRLAEARKGHGSMTDAAALRIEKLLRTQLSERQASPAELAALSKTLLADMAPPSTGRDASQ